MDNTRSATGPLAGIRVVELAGIGPAPFCCLMLADMGADVVRVDRADKVKGRDPASPPVVDVLSRGRRSIGVDLKSLDGAGVVLDLVSRADIFIEGFRPGVTERLGIGPDECLARNPRLVYGRMTGWGQDGPLAQAAGHDINYIALSGALWHIGRAGQPPTPPLNLLGDFGGGAMLLLAGVLAGLVETQRSGQGQVVDAAMVDGAALLMSPFFAASSVGGWVNERGANMLDTGAPFYDVYECADGNYISVGSLEPQFYKLLIGLLELDGEALPHQYDRTQWATLRERFAGLFLSRTQREWCELLEGTDVCFAPVLSMREVPSHPHMQQRGTIVEYHGVQQPAPAPRFSRTPSAIDSPPPHAGQHTMDVLAEWLGCDDDQTAKLRDTGAIR